MAAKTPSSVKGALSSDHMKQIYNSDPELARRRETHHSWIEKLHDVSGQLRRHDKKLKEYKAELLKLERTIKGMKKTREELVARKKRTRESCTAACRNANIRRQYLLVREKDAQLKLLSKKLGYPVDKISKPQNRVKNNDNPSKNKSQT